MWGLIVVKKHGSGGPNRMRNGKVCDRVRGLFAQPSLNRNPATIGCRQMSGRAMGFGEYDA